MNKIRVGIVNYLNTKPLLYGLQHSAVKERIDLVHDHPANLVTLLKNGDIEVGLVPVTVLSTLDRATIISDYCIGCDGAVASVCLFGDVSIQQAEEVLLDYQSRTSVALTKILLKDYWKVSPRLVDTEGDFLHKIQGSTMGLVIGDRSFYQRKQSEYVYDLGEAWKTFTGLPFVFAAWVSTSRLEESFIEEFNDANRLGVQNIDRVASETRFDHFDMHQYFIRHISYELDDQKRQGLRRFLSMLEVPAFL